MVSDQTQGCFIWLDYTCATREIKTSSDVILDKVLEVSDVMLTPLVDAQHANWELPVGITDYLVDYKATAWTGSLKSYVNRGWNRAEMFFSIDIPVAENADGSTRVELFRGECKYLLKKGKRPHLIYGTKESKAGALPIVLAPLQITQYADMNPLNGFFSVERDKLIVQELVEHVKFNRHTPVEEFRGSIDENEKKYGYGVLTYPNGNQYKGEFEEDMRDGRGKMFFANGAVCNFF